MSGKEDDLKRALERINTRSRRSKIINIVFTVLVLCFTIGWLFFTQQQVHEIDEKLIAKKDSLNMLEDVITERDSQIKVAEAYLASLDSIEHIVDPDWVYYTKVLFNEGNEMPQILVILEELAFHPKLKFRAYGSSLESGFSSPGMVGYVLTKMGVLTEKEHVWGSSNLKQNLKTKVELGNLRNGDVIFYQYGYCMFYINTMNFVIGMTPYGIKAFNQVDYLKIQDIRRPDY